jgi:soluble lytic murein transglycosylase-like protein
MSRGALTLTLLGAVFLWPRSSIVKAGATPTTTAAKYHLLRFYGAKPKAPKSVIDVEIDRAADREGLPRKLFHALVHIESRKNPRAVSPVGAIGLSQVMPANAKRCGLSNARMLFDPIANLRCGAQILREDMDTYGGSIHNALVSYNCGRLKCPQGHQYARNVLGLASRMSG